MTAAESRVPAVCLAASCDATTSMYPTTTRAFPHPRSANSPASRRAAVATPPGTPGAARDPRSGSRSTPFPGNTTTSAPAATARAAASRISSALASRSPTHGLIWPSATRMVSGDVMASFCPGVACPIGGGRASHSASVAFTRGLHPGMGTWTHDLRAAPTALVRRRCCRGPVLVNGAGRLLQHDRRNGRAGATGTSAGSRQRHAPAPRRQRSAPHVITEPTGTPSADPTSATSGSSTPADVARPGPGPDRSRRGCRSSTRSSSSGAGARTTRRMPMTPRSIRPRVSAAPG